uniref:Uncharacterized protein n=1 Tax=viral metagenome TaxID=1070528 RepID=A0A6C0HQB1_9ZZZZ
MNLIGILFVVVCVVVLTREKREPFELKKMNDFFELADPYMTNMKQLYVDLKSSGVRA